MLTTISNDDFNKLVRFIHTQYGIDLSQKRQLVTSRLSSLLSQKGYTDFGPFVSDLLRKQDPADMELVLNRLTTNYTFFMREQEHFDFFKGTILPELVKKHQRDKVLAIWSAGCSSGEEPYNISIYIKEFLGSQAGLWDTRVLATDISQKALAAAKRGIYELPDTIPAAWKKKYFRPVPGGKQYMVAPLIRDNVIFQTFNLMDPIKFRLKFDVIFCRNVMIYFDQPTKDALMRRFYDALTPGGYFMISHSENLSKNSPFATIAPSTFQKQK
ncbi:MAG: protein-glutamate O-methyltransferase CheR [Oscillibacter sp.]|nr:protein-glutamate O-methyltransferase CheR [Oscillibacter sp.]